MDLMPLYQSLLAATLGLALILRGEHVRRRRDRRERLLRALRSLSESAPGALQS
jgi:hypothetical protein